MAYGFPLRIEGGKRNTNRRGPCPAFKSCQLTARAKTDRILTAPFNLLLLTFCAAWVNMLAFLSLGRVFASFMTGNFLFIGVGLIQGSHALLVRAIIAVGVYFISIALSSLILGHLLEQRTPLSRFHSFVRFLVPEWFFLLGFALLWQFTNDLSHNDGMQITLLCIAVFAMGIQGVLVQKFDFPGVIVNALTGTEIMLGRRLAQDTIVHRS